MKIEPYLFLDGRCEEAIEFYKSTLGAEVTMLMRFKDSPEPHAPGMLPPGAENKVMHASLRWPVPRSAELPRLCPIAAGVE